MICERGIGAKSTDVEGFSQGLKFLLENETERRAMADRAAIFVKQGYSKERLITDMLAFYQRLVGEQPVLSAQHSEEMHVR